MPKYAATHHEITKKTKYICIKKHMVKIIVRVIINKLRVIIINFFSECTNKNERF